MTSGRTSSWKRCHVRFAAQGDACAGVFCYSRHMAPDGSFNGAQTTPPPGRYDLPDDGMALPAREWQRTDHSPAMSRAGRRIPDAGSRPGCRDVAQNRGRVIEIVFLLPSSVPRALPPSPARTSKEPPRSATGLVRIPAPTLCPEGRSVGQVASLFCVRTDDRLRRPRTLYAWRRAMSRTALRSGRGRA